MKLGFTFYPQDWWSSDTFYDFNAFERYVYLECLFLMYRNGGYMKTEKTHFENRIRINVSNEVWDKVVKKFIIHNEEFTSLAVNKRLKKAETARENGLLGGRPNKITQKSNLVNQEDKAKVKEKEKTNQIEIESDSFVSVGLMNDLYVIIMPKNVHAIKYRIMGEDGLDLYFQMHGSIVNRPEYKRKFLLDRKGKLFTDFMHLWNDYNQFVNRQFK